MGAEQRKGAFVDGAGEDTAYEKLVGAAPGSFFTTIAIQPSASISVTSLYVGTSRPALPNVSAVYDAFDDVGSLTGTSSSFNSPPKLGTLRLSGVLVAGGTLDCDKLCHRWQRQGIRDRGVFDRDQRLQQRHAMSDGNAHRSGYHRTRRDCFAGGDQDRRQCGPYRIESDVLCRADGLQRTTSRRSSPERSRRSARGLRSRSGFAAVDRQ